MSVCRQFLYYLASVNRAFYMLIGWLLIVMALSTFLQVLVRFVFTFAGFNFSAPWTEELARYSMIWVVFIGMGIGCRHAQLISLDFVVNHIPSIAGKLLRIIALLICLSFFILLMKVGFAFVEFGLIERSPAMSLRKSWIYWAMPVGAGLAFVNTIGLMTESWVLGNDIREPSSVKVTLPDNEGSL